MDVIYGSSVEVCKNNMKDGAHLLRKEQIEERIKMLSTMRDEANELARLTAKMDR